MCRCAWCASWSITAGSTRRWTCFARISWRIVSIGVSIQIVSALASVRDECSVMNIAGLNIFVEICASQTSNWILKSEEILLDESVFNWNIFIFEAGWALTERETLPILNHSNHSLAFSWVQLAPVIGIVNISLCIIRTVLCLVVFKIHLEIVRICVSSSHFLSKCANIWIVSDLIVLFAKKWIFNDTTAKGAFVGICGAGLQWQNVSTNASCSRENCPIVQEFTILCTNSAVESLLVVCCEMSANFCVEGISLVKSRGAPCETAESGARADEHRFGCKRDLFRE